MVTKGQNRASYGVWYNDTVMEGGVFPVSEQRFFKGNKTLVNWLGMFGVLQHSTLVENGSQVEHGVFCGQHCVARITQ
tara:strand:+ start:4431 stop:4664 length:234 start_codon:yes stop_codon:yes gene_type:complete